MQARVLTAEDAAIWRALRLEALKTYPSAFLVLYEEALAQPLSEVAARLAQGNTLGVFDGATCVGIASLIPQSRPQTRHRAEIGAFYVTPVAHGTGAGDALLAGVLAHADGLGCWQTELYVAETNEHAIGLYARHGFEQVGRLPNSVILDGAAVHDVIMVRLAPGGENTSK